MIHKNEKTLQAHRLEVQSFLKCFRKISVKIAQGRTMLKLVLNPQRPLDTV